MSEEGAAAPAARRWQVLGLVLLTAIGGYAVAVSLRLGLWRQGSPGEGLFPFITAMTMMAFSLIGLVGALRAVPRPEANGAELRDAPLRIGVYVAGLVFYAAALDALGFIVSTIVAVVFILRCAERYSWLTAFALAAGTAAGCQVLFVTWLGAILPTGFLWDALFY